MMFFPHCSTVIRGTGRLLASPPRFVSGPPRSLQGHCLLYWYEIGAICPSVMSLPVIASVWLVLDIPLECRCLSSRDEVGTVSLVLV
jgi:hypothetical protein